MKILYLVNHFSEYGGIEQMLHQKILALNNYVEKIDVVLVTRYQNNKSFLFESHKLTKKHDLDCDVLSRGKMQYLKFYKRLRKIISEENPTVVVSTLTSYYAMILPFMSTRIPKIVEFHSTSSTIKSGQWKFKSFFYNRYDSVVVLNEDEAKSFQLDNLEIIPNFIHQTNRSKYPSFLERKKTIISAGRLDEVKQFDHLILAWKKIRNKFPDWKVEIFGTGTQYGFLNDLIGENNLSDTVFLMGRTTNLKSIMEVSSVYCLTSKTDCFPMVLLEAKQSALPIVSYDCPYGPKHIVKHNEDGILTEAGNIILLSDTLSNLMLNGDKREQMSKKAHENSLEHSSQKVIQQWIKLFYRLQTK